MTEDQGTTPPETPQAAPAPEAVTTDQAKAEAPKGNPGTGRFSVYDTQLARYVGGVRDTKPTAAEARKLAPNGHTVVEV